MRTAIRLSVLALSPHREYRRRLSWRRCSCASSARLVGCTSEPVNDQSKAPTNAAELGCAEPSEEAFVPFDVRPLLKPAHKYFGAALDGAPASLRPVKDFTTKVGKQPNMLLYYTAWGDQFDAKAVKNARAMGALPVMEWEPFEPSIADIADGVSDDYIREVCHGRADPQPADSDQSGARDERILVPLGYEKDIPG